MPLAVDLGSALEKLLEDRVTTDPEVLMEHGKDESSHDPHPPEAVVFPKTTEEVAKIVKLCAHYGTPIVPFGRGSAVEGGITAPYGGVSVSTRRMNRILAVHEDDFDADVEAGVTQTALNEALADTDLFFSVNPGAEASIGGMASTRASGTNAMRYGTMRENVLGLTVVLADGRIVRTAHRARKSSAGYDLTRLFVGAEGTLGIITEVTVKLHRRAEAVSTAVCPFPSIDDAVATVIDTLHTGIPIARVELLDEAAIEAVNRYADLDYEPAPTLFFEFQGSPAGAVEQAERVEPIAQAHRGSSFRWTADETERQRLWQARHHAYYACLDLRPEGARVLSTDVCVPISRLAECIVETKRELDASAIPSPLLGHVGDGNFHILFVVDPENEDEIAEAEQLNERLVERALAMDGTCTGEHGVGIGKKKFMQAEHGEGLGVMRDLKQALDPGNLMNPGKVLP